MDYSASFLPSSIHIPPSFSNQSKSDGKEVFLNASNVKAEEGFGGIYQDEGVEDFSKLLKGQFNRKKGRNNGFQAQSDQNVKIDSRLGDPSKIFDFGDLSAFQTGKDLKNLSHLKDIKNLPHLKDLEAFDVLKDLKEGMDGKGEYSFFMAKGEGFVDHLNQKLELKPWQVVIFSNQWDELGKEGFKDLSHKKWNQIMNSMALSSKQKALAEDFLGDFIQKARDDLNALNQPGLNQAERKFSFLSQLPIGTIGKTNREFNEKFNQSYDLLKDSNQRIKQLENVDENQKGLRLELLSSEPSFLKKDQPLKGPFIENSMKAFHPYQDVSSPKEVFDQKSVHLLPLQKGVLKGQGEGVRGQKLNLGESFLSSKNQKEDSNFVSDFNHHLQLEREEPLSNRLKVGNFQMKGTKELSNLDHIIQKVQWISENQGEGEIRMQLKPEKLGELVLRVSNINDQVNIQLLAESVEAKKLLQNYLFDLKESLNLKQIKVDQIMIGSLFETSTGDLDSNFKRGDENRFSNQENFEFFDQSSGKGKGNSEGRDFSSAFENFAPTQDKGMEGKKDKNSLEGQEGEFSYYKNLGSSRGSNQRLNIRV